MNFPVFSNVKYCNMSMIQYNILLSSLNIFQLNWTHPCVWGGLEELALDL